MKWMIVILLAVCPVLVDAQIAGKDAGKLPVAGTGQQTDSSRTTLSRVILIKRDIIICRIPEEFELLNDGRNSTTYKLHREEIDRLPYTNTNDILSMLPGVYQQQRGAGISVCGSR